MAANKNAAAVLTLTLSTEDTLPTSGTRSGNNTPCLLMSVVRLNRFVTACFTTDGGTVWFGADGGAASPMLEAAFGKTTLIRKKFALSETNRSWTTVSTSYDQHSTCGHNSFSGAGF